MTTPYDSGQNGVYVVLGIEKTAFKGKLLSRAGTFLRRMGRGAKEMAIGSPVKSTREILSGKGWRAGNKQFAPGVLRAGFVPQGKTPLRRAGSAALMYSFPAYETYKAIKEPEGGVGESIGRVLGSTAGMYAGWKPYGMLGSSLLGASLGNIGGRIGRLGDTAYRKATGTQPEETPQPTPYEVYQQYHQK